MDVVLSIRVTNEDWEKLRRVAKPPARSVSPIISEIIMAYERKEKTLPARTAGTPKQTSVVIDHTVKDALVLLAKQAGLSSSEALQFMIHEYIKEAE